ncbi:hypothetical protein ACFLRM_01960 [Acidobacteriota bacterium]
MKKYFTWTVSVGILLVSASAVTYSIHFILFHDLHHIFIYMVGDIAFLFLDVLLVILFIERLLSRKEKKSIMQKLNMVIGTFFSEVGLELLKKFSFFVSNTESLARQMEIQPNWSKKDFKKAIAACVVFDYEIKIDKDSLVALRTFLISKRSFMLQLLENPNLLEHDRFTDLLWAVFHLTEELEFRGDKIRKLPEKDYEHLKGDLKRAYCQITNEWISYNSHLKDNYPFLFSLAARINPMNPQASPIVS